MTPDIFCERCGQKLNDQTMVSLELSNTTNRYHKDGIPEGEQSQGWFDFGVACAKAVIKNGGVCKRLQP